MIEPSAPTDLPLSPAGGLLTPDDSTRAPGARLRQARESQGLSLERLASVLKVAPAKLQALEEGRHEALPDAAFVRALAQAVCRVLRLDPAPVLAGLPAASSSPLASAREPLNQPFKDARLSSQMFDSSPRSEWRWPSLQTRYVVPACILLLALVIYHWPDTTSRPAWLAAWTTVSEPTEPAEPGASLPAVAASVPVATVLAPEPAASQAESTVPVVGSASEPLAQPAAASAAASVAAPTSGELVLSVREDAWIEVLDAVGNKQVSRLVKAGERVAPAGVPPWQLRIGHASGVNVALRGEPVDLTPYIRNNVARLELK